MIAIRRQFEVIHAAIDVGGMFFHELCEILLLLSQHLRECSVAPRNNQPEFLHQGGSGPRRGVVRGRPGVAHVVVEPRHVRRGRRRAP
jgi:hypothetical protein